MTSTPVDALILDVSECLSLQLLSQFKFCVKVSVDVYSSPPTGQENMRYICLSWGHVDLKTTFPLLNPTGLHYLFIAFISILFMPIGHLNWKSTCPHSKSTCPGRSGSHLIAPCPRASSFTKLGVYILTYVRVIYKHHLSRMAKLCMSKCGLKLGLSEILGHEQLHIFFYLQPPVSL